MSTKKTKGALYDDAERLFQRAYGLNGFVRERHDHLISEIIATYQCAPRAVFSLLYGFFFSLSFVEKNGSCLSFQVVFFLGSFTIANFIC